MTFNRKRALEVLGPAYVAYKMKEGLFALRHGENGDAPQDRFIPDGVERGSADHSIFLFFATGTDRKQVSSQVYSNHARLWSRHPQLYREKVLRMTLKSLEKKLRSCSFNMINTIARNWQPCAETLYVDFAGNPTLLYEGRSIDDVIKYKKHHTRDGRDPLPGFGPKILSLLAIFFEKLGLVPEIEGSFPVDVHVQRICISTGVISATGIVDSAKVGEFIRPRLYELCKLEGWDRSDLAHALWFLGSQLCTRCPDSRNCASLCPVYQECSGGLNTEGYQRRGEWDFEARRLPKGTPNLVLF